MRQSLPRPLEIALAVILVLALGVFLLDLAVTTDNERIDRAARFATGEIAHVPATYKYCGESKCPQQSSFIGTEETYRTLVASVETRPGGYVVWFRDPRSCTRKARDRDCHRVRVIFRGEEPYSVAYLPRLITQR